MSNLSGYSDYRGPEALTRKVNKTLSAEYTPSLTLLSCPNSLDLSIADLNENENHSDCVRAYDNDSDSATSHSDCDSDCETNPLQVGFWMEGDSLAPPCGCSVFVIQRILEFANVTRNDVLYDLGCGDGRICLEAYARYHCRTIGVEIEEDLVQRARQLVQKCYGSDDQQQPKQQLSAPPQIVHEDLRVVLDQLVQQVHLLLPSSPPDSRSSSLTNTSPPNSCCCSNQNQYMYPLPTIIVLYLLPEAIALIQPSLMVLLKAIPALRILCNTWGLQREDEEGSDLRRSPFQTLQVEDESTLALTDIFLYASDCLYDRDERNDTILA